jgi:hypothetical protein
MSVPWRVPRQRDLQERNFVHVRHRDLESSLSIGPRLTGVDTGSHQRSERLYAAAVGRTRRRQRGAPSEGGLSAIEWVMIGLPRGTNIGRSRERFNARGRQGGAGFLSHAAQQRDLDWECHQKTILSATHHWKNYKLRCGSEVCPELTATDMYR